MVIQQNLRCHKGCVWLCTKGMHLREHKGSEFLGRRNCCGKEKSDKLCEKWDSIRPWKVGSSWVVDERAYYAFQPGDQALTRSPVMGMSKVSLQGIWLHPPQGWYVVVSSEFNITWRDHPWEKHHKESEHTVFGPGKAWVVIGLELHVILLVVHEEVRVPKHGEHFFPFLPSHHFPFK